MQSALLNDRAQAGELSSEGLMCASVQLFNREALTQYARTYSAARWTDPEAREEIEVLLALEIGLKNALDLPPRMVSNTHAAEHPEVPWGVTSEVLERVNACYGAAGDEGLLAFLSNQTSFGFCAWSDLLRRDAPGVFDDLDNRRDRQMQLPDSDNSEAYRQALEKLKADHERGQTEQVAELTAEWLIRQRPQSRGEGLRSARAMQAFHAAVGPVHERRKERDRSLLTSQKFREHFLNL